MATEPCQLDPETRDSRDELERQLIGNAIAARRHAMHISQEELANRAAIDRSFMGRVEQGRQSMTLPKFVDVCRVLGVTPSQLLAEAFASFQSRLNRHATSRRRGHRAG
ncbi:helix-turn-helix transcriptional regulator [Bifidobacterium sp. BRDM6]|uniref:Helix-turn-helix transcriptional regulator n=2 Tax=Bifidobacterium choloepi TaxID=2614131 RepID=A0A6I5N637_9BIFI|nr:helix-turn-helix transcriptional regulator [Bifidobacterium choloepi]